MLAAFDWRRLNNGMKCFPAFYQRGFDWRRTKGREQALDTISQLMNSFETLSSEDDGVGI